VVEVFAFLTELYCVGKNQVRLKLYGTYRQLVYADEVNLQSDNTDTINKHTETLLDTSKKIDLQVNTEKTKYMLLSYHQNAVQSYDIKIANRCFGNMEKFKYFGTAITN
jgi:hypothetical protein